MINISHNLAIIGLLSENVDGECKTFRCDYNILFIYYAAVVLILLRNDNNQSSVCFLKVIMTNTIWI